jgi:hypothetical protein
LIAASKAACADCGRAERWSADAAGRTTAACRAKPAAMLPASDSVGNSASGSRARLRQANSWRSNSCNDRRSLSGRLHKARTRSTGPSNCSKAFTVRSVSCHSSPSTCTTSLPSK